MRLQSAPLAASQARLPVFLFSHGLGGTRGAYSAVCAELASAVRGRSCFCHTRSEVWHECITHHLHVEVYWGRNLRWEEQFDFASARTEECMQYLPWCALTHRAIGLGA